MDKSVESVEKSLSQRQILTPDKASQVLGVFAKQPLAGQVKTRLCPPLTFQQAADLYRVCLQETLERMSATGRRVVLFYAGEQSWFAERFPRVSRFPQAEGDLGRRMQQALQQLLTVGCPAALIGTDSPDLPEALVDEAFSALDRHDAVTAPAADGGYVLVGCRRPCPELFERVSWSTGEVLRQTRERARRAGLAYLEVAGWEDLDDGPALLRLLSRSPQSLTAGHVREKLLPLLAP